MFSNPRNYSRSKVDGGHQSETPPSFALRWLLLFWDFPCPPSGGTGGGRVSLASLQNLRAAAESAPVADRGSAERCRPPLPAAAGCRPWPRDAWRRAEPACAHRGWAAPAAPRQSGAGEQIGCQFCSSTCESQGHVRAPCLVLIRELLRPSSAHPAWYRCGSQVAISRPNWELVKSVLGTKGNTVS